MANILILPPAPIAGLTATRGSGAINMLTPDPKEVWVDGAPGTTAFIDIDLGAVIALDTVFLGSCTPAMAGTLWTISGGAAGPTEAILMPTCPLRAVDAAGQAAPLSHGFWTGAVAMVRYLRLAVTQPAGSLPLAVGNVLCGKAFTPTYNREWGSGRRVIDTGSATALPSGGYAIVEGARKAAFSWTLGDLTDEETEALYAMQLDRGETRPVLVAEDPAATTGQRNRLHYGRLTSLRAFERRNPAQTRWEFSIEEWL